MKNFDGTNYGAHNFDRKGDEYRILLNDGTSLMFYAENGGGNIKIDVDGANGENTIGKDIFYVQFNQMTMEPGGQEVEGGYQNACLDNLTGNGSGYYCSAWVVYNGNMDYLHCPDKLKANNWSNCRGK